jgi:hypothetical protein
MYVIIKLDNTTLNLYTAVRAEFGTRELSWISLDLSRIEALPRVQRSREDRQS